MSGLWSFKRKNQEQTLNSVLSALPTASVPVIGSKTLFVPDQYDDDDHTFSPSFVQQQQQQHRKPASPSPQPNPASARLLKSALQETESIENAHDPDSWAALRSKWMAEDFYNTKEYYQPQEEQEQRSSTKEEEVVVRVGNKWLYQISPEKNPKMETENISEQRGRSLSHSLDRRYDHHQHQQQNASPEMMMVQGGDVIDYKTLLSRIERQVMMEPAISSPSPKLVVSPKPPRIDEHKHSSFVAPSFSPPPRLSPQQQQQQQQFTVMQVNPTSFSYITVAPVQSSSMMMQNHSIYSTNPKDVALARASKSLARTDANLEEIFYEQQESAKKQQQKRMILQRTSSSVTTNHSTAAASRSVVATRLMFRADEPKTFARTITTTVATTTAKTARSNSTQRSNSSSAMAINNNYNNIETALQTSQQASRSASSLVKKVVDIQKPSSRAEIQKQVSSRFADPNSKEFKALLDKELELLEAEKKLKELESRKRQHVVIGVRPPCNTTVATNKRKPLAPVVHQQQQPAFVERMVQRTKEREESRKQLLQKYDEEKQARIQREIQEAEDDAQRTLAERTKAAKLREKMQRKMREEEERKIKLKQVEDGMEQLGEVMNRRHFLGFAAFYPWRRHVQQKQRQADLLNDRHLLQQGFSRLKMNVTFERKLRDTLFVSRCIGVTRLLKRWTMRFVLMKFRRNVLDSKRDVRDAKKQHLKFCLRRWKRKAMKHRFVSERSKEKWTEEKCVEAEEFRSQMQLRQAFRKWNQKLSHRNEEREREKIRLRMWSIARSVLED